MAVSNTAQKKVVGSLLGDSEKTIRRELNRIGLALLTFSEKQPENWEDAFEFEAKNKNGEDITGEILAKNPESAFDQLSTLDLKRLIYVCRSDATEDEKIIAREESIPKIIEKKKKIAEDQQEAEKRTLVGGLKLILGTDKKKKLQEEIWKKYSTDKFEKKLIPKNIPPGEKPIEEKKEGEIKQKFLSIVKPEIEKTEIENEIKTIQQKEVEESPPKIKFKDSAEEKITSPEKIKEDGYEDENEDEDEERERMTEKIKIPFNIQLKKAIQDAKQKFGKFYFLLTKIIIPLKDKTRKDGWKEMFEYLFIPKKTEIMEDKNSLSYQLRTFFEFFWVSVEEIVDVLAAVFLAYFLIGLASLFIEIPRVTELAEQTLKGNYLIPFLTGGFIFVRILMFLRDKFTRARPIRTSLLFLSGGTILFVSAINLL